MRDGKASSRVQKPRLDRTRATYAATALLIFCVEVAIALFVKSGFVRHTLSDVFVVMLLYAALMAVAPLPRVIAAGLCFVFACAVEVGQALGLVERLGLSDMPLARIVIGTTFSWSDIAAYAAGAFITVIADSAARRRLF